MFPSQSSSDYYPSFTTKTPKEKSTDSLSPDTHSRGINSTQDKNVLNSESQNEGAVTNRKTCFKGGKTPLRI